MRRAIWGLGVGLVVGCYHPSPPAGVPCDDESPCPSTQVCVAGHCEVPGDPGLDSGGDAACDVQPTCVGADLVSCDAPVTCALGCSIDGSPHCRVLVPSNGLTTDLLSGASRDVDGSERWTFNTDTGEIRKGQTILRAAGDEGVDNGIGFHVVDGVGVFSAHSFTVDDGNGWNIDGGRPATLFAATTITVADTIDAGGFFAGAGPGGAGGNTSTSSGTCRGRAGRLIAVNTGEGGGGGGGASAGGAGGPSSAANPTGAGGMVCTSSPSTVPLRGGWGGGAGGANTANNGGGGGGGLSLVAMEQITIASTGAVIAPGGGGQSSAGGEGGGGGGGGGAILIEAPSVVIHGALAANGGSGGAPTENDGMRGLTSTSPAVGGSYTGPGGTRKGGNGATGTLAATDGQNYTFDDGAGTVISRGAGGGGGVGRIEIRAQTRDTGGITQSPAAILGDAVLQ